MTIEEAQEECKRRFPIGCKYKCAEEGILYTLKDDGTYYNTGTSIWAHRGAGLLYSTETTVNKTTIKFATLVSLPKGYVMPTEPKPKKDDLKPLIKLLKEII